MTQRLLPQPKELSPLEGTFALDADTLILVPTLAGDGAFFAARQLQDEVGRATGLTLPIVKAFAPPRSENVILLVCGEEQATAFGVEPVTVGAPETVAAQAYALTITPDAELETLRAEFESLWLARARRSEIHVALGYYANLRARYRAAINWLEEQRQALAKGRPVDAELSTYDAGGYRTLWQTWPD